MRILVIGGTGFIGKHVAEKLVASGHSLAVLHRATSSLAGPIQEISVDRDEPGDLKTAIHRFRPDVVLDMIPYTEPQARDLVEAARTVTGRLVIVSSADVYRNYDGLRGKSASPPDPIPLDEDAPLRETRFPYRGEGLKFDHAEDYDKILVELAVSGIRDLPATILRLPAVYGPGDGHRLRSYLKRMAAQRPFLLLSEEQSRWLWTRSYVENVAAAIALAVTDSRAAGRVYNVGEEPTLPEASWAAAIARVVGWRGEIVTMPAAELPESLRTPYDWRYHLSSDTGRIRREIGYVEPVAAEEALRRSVEAEWANLSEAPEPDYSSEDEAVRSYSSRTTRRTIGPSGPSAARTK
jgi:nucleoside-diphosphate-sugar epimerase